MQMTFFSFSILATYDVVEGSEFEPSSGNTLKNSKEDASLGKAPIANELLDEKVIQMIISRSEKADKYSTAIASMKEAINRHWRDLEELRKNKEMEEIQNAQYLKVSVKKVCMYVLQFGVYYLIKAALFENFIYFSIINISDFVGC